MITGGLFALAFLMLQRLPLPGDRWASLPFFTGIAIFALGFNGLAYSFYPYVVPDRLTFAEAASAPESLMIILVGALVMVPVIAAYSALSYWVFRGKATNLTYH